MTVPDLILHVNYFEAGYSMDEKFDKVLEHGYDGIELRGVPGDGSDDAHYLASVKSAMERTGMRNVVLSLSPNLMDPDAANRQAAIARFEGVLRAGASMGVLTYNASTGAVLAEGAGYMEFDKNGSAAATDEQWEWAVAGFRHLGAVAEELGAVIAFEVHNCLIHDLAASTKKLLEMIDCPAVGANLDMGNVFLNVKGESLPQAIEILGDRIYYVHLKNGHIVRGGGWFLTHISDGDIDNRLFLRQLKVRGYKGKICLEAPRPGDRDYFARVDLAYVRGLLQDLGWE